MGHAGACGPQVAGDRLRRTYTHSASKGLLGVGYRGLTFHPNLITFLCPLAERHAKQVVLALEQEVRAGDLVWSKHVIH